MTTLADTFLSMLDLTPMRTGGSVAEVLHNPLDLAYHIERLGFNRLWLAKRHNMDGIASSATALLIDRITGGTSRVRADSGGAMLPNHVPLVVAENSDTLETLYLGRVDLGLGHAPGVDQTTMRALRRDRLDNGDDLPEQVAELEVLFGPRHFQQSLLTVPGEGTQAPIRLLGSNLSSAHLAAQKGLLYTFASRFVPCYPHETLRIYRGNFQPSAVLDKPYAVIGMPLIVAPTDKKVESLATTAFQRVLALIHDESLRQKPLVESMAPLRLPHEQDVVGNFLGLAMIDGPEKARARLGIFLERTSANGLIFASDFYEHAHRLRPCEIVAGLKEA